MIVVRLLLAAVFAWAGIEKLRNPLDTRRTFRALRLPRVRVLSVAVPAVELLTAALLVGAPVAGGAAAATLLLAFTVLMITDISQGRATPCGCFGPRSTKPISWSDVARNIALTALAVLVVLAG